MNYLKFLEEALREAELAFQEGNVPIGALIVDKEGNIISSSHNKTKTTFDATSHAEINAIRNAGELVIENKNSEPTFLYTTMEPCIACSFFITRTNIKNVIWALSDPYRGGFLDLLENNKVLSDISKITYVVEPDLNMKIRSKELYIQYCKNRGYEDRVKMFESII